MTLSEPLNIILNETSEFTDESKGIATFVATILHHDEPNNIKVEIIKEALQTKQYQINPEHIANKLLEFAPLTETALV